MVFLVSFIITQNAMLVSPLFMDSNQRTRKSLLASQEGFPQKDLERREVEKRIYGSSEIAARTPVLTVFPKERKRLTASACLSDNSIIDPFEHVITELKTKNDFFVNESS